MNKSRYIIRVWKCVSRTVEISIAFLHALSIITDKRTEFGDVD